MIHSWDIGAGVVLRNKVSNDIFIIISETIMDSYGLRSWHMIKYKRYNNIFRLVRILEEADINNYEVL
jgi:hypothetical protein